MIRTILAVIVGYLSSMILTVISIRFTLSDSGAGSETTDNAYLLLFAVSLLTAIIGGFITATIAAKDRIRHALYLGMVMIVLGILHYFLVPSEAPSLYQFGFIFLTLPAAWSGGLLRERLAHTK